MYNWFHIDHWNGTVFDWDESRYNVLYYLYDIERIEDGNVSKSEVILDTQPSNSSSIEQYYENNNALFRFYVEGIAILVVTILGTVGNIISGWILSRPKMKSPINCLLFALSIADTTFITLNIFILVLPTIFLTSSVKIELLVILTPIFYPIVVTAHNASVLMTVVVTIERYIAVCDPLKARINFTWKQSKWMASSVFLASFIYNLPKWFEFTVIAIENPNGTVNRLIPITTELRRDPIYEKYYVYLAYFIFIFSLPLIILIVFNTLIYRQVKRSNLQRRSLSSSERTENQTTKMLFMVVLVFILCNALTLVGIAAKFISENPSIDGIDSIRNFSVIFNSCINFVIYCAYGEKFRDTFISLLPRWFQQIFCKSFVRKQLNSLQSIRSNSSDKGRPISFISRFTSNPTEAVSV